MKSSIHLPSSVALSLSVKAQRENNRGPRAELCCTPQQLLKAAKCIKSPVWVLYILTCTLALLPLWYTAQICVAGERCPAWSCVRGTVPPSGPGPRPAAGAPPGCVRWNCNGASYWLTWLRLCGKRDGWRHSTILARTQDPFKRTRYDMNMKNLLNILSSIYTII